MSGRPISKPGAAPHTTSAHDDEDWRTHAACLGIDPETWWPTGDTSLEDRDQIAVAKTICARCPVLDTCRQDALNHRIEYGIWGGLTENERRAMTPTAVKPAPKPKAAAPAKRDPTPRTSCGRERGYQAHTNHGERHCDTCRAWRARGKKAEAA